MDCESYNLISLSQFEWTNQMVTVGKWVTWACSGRVHLPCGPFSFLSLILGCCKLSSFHLPCPSMPHLGPRMMESAHHGLSKNKLFFLYTALVEYFDHSNKKLKGDTLYPNYYIPLFGIRPILLLLLSAMKTPCRNPFSCRKI